MMNDAQVEPAQVDGMQNNVIPINPDQEELINRLVFYQEEYEVPSKEDTERIMELVSEINDVSDKRFKLITEMMIATTQLIYEFAKRAPGFKKLCPEDKITLFKASSSEVLILRMARRYDFATDSIIFANNQPYSRDSFILAGLGNIIEDLLLFGRCMYDMKVNNAEYGLLAGILLFSARPHLSEAWKVKKIQEVYLDTLKAYVQSRPNAFQRVDNLLLLIDKLRTLDKRHREIGSKISFDDEQSSLFFAEFFEVISSDSIQTTT